MEIETFILVGGRSSRMGSDKATLRLGGVTLAERLTAIAGEAFPGAPVTLVAAGPEQFSDLPVVIDVYPDRGPLGGLHTALTHAKTEWIFLAGCDLPFITAGLISRLCNLRTNETDAVVPVQSDGIVQPLCALYRVDPCLKKAHEMLEKTETPSLRDFLDEISTHRVGFDEISDLPGSESFFLNINTPADLERAQSLCV